MILSTTDADDLLAYYWRPHMRSGNGSGHIMLDARILSARPILGDACGCGDVGTLDGGSRPEDYVPECSAPQMASCWRLL
jgi:hypothetical protein